MTPQDAEFFTKFCHLVQTSMSQISSKITELQNALNALSLRQSADFDHLKSQVSTLQSTTPNATDLANLDALISRVNAMHVPSVTEAAKKP